jgi:hypothetical protein
VTGKPCRGCGHAEAALDAARAAAAAARARGAAFSEELAEAVTAYGQALAQDIPDGALYQMKTEASGTVGTGTGPPPPGDDEDEEPA